MADDMAVIYRRYRPEIDWSRVIKSKHKNYTRHNADGKTTKRFSNVHEPCSNATFKKSKSSFREWQDLIVTVKQNTRKHKRKKSNGQQIPQRPQLSAKRSTRLTTDEYLKILTKKCSTPMKHNVEDDSIHGMKRTRSDTQLNTSTPYQTKFIVNTLLLGPNTLQPERQHVLNHPLMQARLRIYRCQLSTTEESCCCSCNSDAMFEVMKSLYDCYKKKNCDHCNCVLCGHLPKEERKLGEARKSLASVGVETDTAKQIRKDNLKKAKEAGFLTPLAGKTPEQREKILRGMANLGLPLPQGKTPSQKALIDKVRQDLGLPPTPKSAAEQDKHENAAKLGLLQPLQGKSKPDKEKFLKNWHDLGIELPEGRSASEKSLIANIKKTTGPKEVSGLPSRKITKSKASGLLTPLEGKTPEQKEKILRGLALSGLPLPEAKTPSLKKLIDKVKKDLGLPPTPKSAAEQEKQDKAAKLGFMQPLEGKSKTEKEKILQNLNGMGIELPEGRTPSEKALIEKIKGGPKDLAVTQSQKLVKAKAAGLLSPLAGKSPEEREKILRGLANLGIPLPEGKTSSLKQLIDKVRKELGLPPEPKSAAERKQHEDAAKLGMLMPLEGKTNAEKEMILQNLHDKKIELPEGRNPSEKALIAKIKGGPKDLAVTQSQKLAKAKAAGLLSPLAGKSPEEREKILRGLANLGIPLPEGKTPSLKQVIDKVRKELGLPPEPKSAAEREQHEDAAKLGMLMPLEGKTNAEKEKILQNLHDKRIELPEGRNPSEKALIAKIKGGPKDLAVTQSQKLAKAKAAGLITSLAGKTPEQKEKILRGLAQSGLPLPAGTTDSEKKLIAKITEEIKAPSPSKVDKATPSVDVSQKLAKAKAAGLLSPLAGKSPKEREKILRGLANLGIPLPEGKTPSLKQVIDKVRKELGLPPEPKSAAERKQHEDAAKLGMLMPLEGKTNAEKEKILQNLHDKKIELPEGRNPSEKALIAKIKGGPKDLAVTQSQKLAKAKAAGLLSPLAGKSPKEREKILRGLANLGIPLPEGKTPSLKQVIDKVRKELGLPPEPKSAAERKQHEDAAKLGMLMPLEGKTNAEKEKILQNLHDKKIELPEGRNPSEKALIAKIKGGPKDLAVTQSQKLAKAKAAGLITSLAGKTPEQKEKILRGLAQSGLPLPAGTTESEKKLIAKITEEIKAPSPSKVDKATPSVDVSQKLAKAKAAGLLSPLAGKSPKEREKILRGLANLGIPLPEGKTPSLKQVIDKVRKELGLPPEPKSAAERKQHEDAAKLGMLMPLEGKTNAEKEKILQNLHDKKIELPEGRNPSEKALIANIKGGPTDLAVTQSQKLAKAKAAGLLSPLAGKSPKERENILRGIANLGIPLPEGKTPSLKQLIHKVRKELGLPPEPKSAAEREQHEDAAKLGMLMPLEGKTNAEKEKILQNLHDKKIELPEGRNPSEKALIEKIKGGPKDLAVTQSQKLAKAKAAGLLSPLAGKSPEEREKILRGLANLGIPLPEGKTPSLKQVIDKVRKELGLPPEPKSAAERKQHEDAAKLGMLMPLEGKTNAEKEKILQNLHDKRIELPEGRNPSEKALIAKIKGGPKDLAVTQSQKLAKAKAAGLITPLAGKTPEQKEKILRGLAQSGLPLPAGTTESEKKLIAKITEEIKAPSPSKVDKATPSVASLDSSPSERLRRAKAAGLLTTLDKKTPEQKEKILRGLALMGLPLPEGKTPLDIKLLGKVRNDLGMPPEPKNKAEKDKYNTAQAAGLIRPLEGKTPAQKEKILRALADKSIPLPIGRTSSEKALIKKILAERKQVPSAEKVASEKLRKAMLSGLSIPLEGKTPEQKMKILRDIAMNGGLLPDGNTPSEIKLIDKVRKDLGLPPTPKSDADKDKYAKAQTVGLMVPLEAKTPEQKEKILRKWAEKNIPLPEGRTASEKSLIKKIQADVKSVSSKAKIASERLRKAKAAGLAVSLTGKSPEQKAQMLHNLANRGYPLPEGKTESEKALIDSIRKTLEEKTAKNITEGKGPSDECICHILAPESVSEARKSKSAGVVTPKKSTLSAREAKAKAAGLLTPLEGKSAADRERILRALVKSRLPLPEGQTPSLKALTDKIRKDMGLPPEPQSPAMKEKVRKGYAGGIVTPLDSKTLAQKENVLKKLKNAGLELPEGRTASEKSLIRKIKASKPGIGITTPLDGKTPSQKETILKKMSAAGVPLPEGRTPSEKAIIAKLATEPSKTQSAKLRKAKAAGLLTPLKGKDPKEQEKILKGLLKAGLPLPEGTTPSEKALIKKVKDDFDAGKVSIELPAKTQSSKLREAKAAGLLTPLKGKSPKEQEKILKALLKAGLPLPEGTTPSEKALIKKVKDDFDAGKVSTQLPEKTQSAKLREAKATGLLTPLKGKSPKEQEKILKALLKAGLPLPEGTTPSEKALIKKVKDEFDAGKVSTELPAKTQSAKLQDAKVAGLLTPLKGKSPEEQEKILKKLLKAGLPLPDGTTPSEKALIKRVQDEFDAAKKAGRLSPASLGKKDSALIRRAKASGLVSSLKGKTSEEKQKIITSLIKAGLPPPKVLTPSEKEMVKKIQTKKGLPLPEGGDTRSKKTIRKSKGTLAAVGAGIREEIQEIVKTDKCDAACGCDKKKIRFKHSYVKIRVTSPDISSFCPCPNECIPGVKAGVFTDNEGIKVTVGSVGIPSYTIHPQITKRNSLENKRSLQSFKESLLPLKISLIGSDCATDDLNSSKSTVYIFNSESDVNISDIERLLRLTLKNNNLKKDLKTNGEKKPVSYIYRSRFADSSGDFHGSLKIAPSTLNLSTSSLRSLYTNTIYSTESSLSHAADLPISMTTFNIYDSDTLSNVSYLENNLKYSSQSINTPQSIERVNGMGSTSTDTLPRKRKSYVTYSNRKIDITNYLSEFSSQLVAKGDTSCASQRSRNPLRGIKRNMSELVQKVPSNKSLSSSSVFVVFSSSGHGDGSSYLHATETLSMLTHSEPSSLLLMNSRPHISLLALLAVVSKAKAQRDMWKRKKARAVLRLRNMTEKLVSQVQKEWRRRLLPHEPVCTSNKYTSSTGASQEREQVEHTVKKTDVLWRKWMGSRGNRAVYQTKHIDTRIHSFSSPSSYCPSTSTVSTTPLYNPQVYVNSQVITNSPVSNVGETLSCIKTDNRPLTLHKTCTYVKSVGEMEWNSPSFSVLRMKTCY